METDICNEREEMTWLTQEINERDRMQDIRHFATSRAEDVKNSLWIRAYQALADAADKVDAMLARTEERSE